MPDQDINVVITRLGLLSEDVSDLKDTLREIATAVTRLALVEERQMQTNEALSRAFKAIDKLDTRMSALDARLASIERDLPMQKQTSGWVVSGVLALAALAWTVVVKKMGVM